MLRDRRIKRRRQKDIKFDAARKLSQCAINGVSCGEWDVREMSPTPSVQKELKYTRVQRFSYASHLFCNASTLLRIILKLSGMKACSLFKALGILYCLIGMIACVWEEVNSFATSDFSWGKACVFQRVKTMDSWAHLLGYLVIWNNLYIDLVAMKSMCF